MGGYANDWFGRSIDDHYPSKYLKKYEDVCDTSGPLGAFEGMIFMSNRRTKKECFDLKLFGLPSSYARVVKHVRPGMKLFLFEYERRQMYGVFEATTNGAMNIDCNAFKQTGRSYPAQVHFRSFWECYPLSEEDFKDAIIENYRSTKEFEFDLSQDQVFKLLQLFASQKIEPQVHEVHDYFENGQDLPRLDLQSETASLLEEVGRSLFAKELLYKNPPLREDCHVGKTIYGGASDAESMLISRRECVHEDLQSRGDCLVGQNICEGDFQALQNMYDTSDRKQRAVLHPLRRSTYTCKHDQLSSDFQPFYGRCPNITENVKNAFTVREIVINETNQNANGEIYDNNTREVIIASNPQNHNTHYYGETEIPRSTLSLDFLPLTLTNNAIDNHRKLRQVPPSLSHANHISDSLSPSVDEFQDGSASDFIGLPRYSSSGMHTLRSNNISKKKSVFTRLKRVQEIDIGHKTKNKDLLREISPAELPFHNSQRKCLSVARNELEVSTTLDDNMQEAEPCDEPILDDRLLIKFKRRSQVCKDGKQVEGQTKQSCGESNSCKPKRRKLIRPEFGSPKTSETSALPLSVVEKVQKCSIENKVTPQPENGAHTMNTTSVSVNSPALNFRHISHSKTMDAIEDESLPTLGCTTNYNNSKCPQCVPEPIRNVIEYSESGFVQLTNEIVNKNLTDLSEMGYPSQMLSPSTNKLDVINIQCDLGMENRGPTAHVTKSTESPNIQVENEKGYPGQKLSPSTNKLDVINIQYDLGMENRGLTAHVTKNTKSANIQVENEHSVKMDISETLTE